MNTITSKLEEEHKVWLEQIRAWEKELDELAATNGANLAKAKTKEATKEVEHFQNQIIIQKSALDKMKHNIKLYGGNIEQGQKEIDDYARYYNELKGKFDAFSKTV